VISFFFDLCLDAFAQMMTVLYVLDVKLIAGRREDVKIGEEKKRNEIAIH